ncbi:MAG: leucine-rich repeat domain-containing protein [Ruminococcus sp.]|nr:leucine-rich repeat domain-containing protein [Ruminococcus sp.]
MKRNYWKKAAAALLAVTLVASSVPANTTVKEYFSGAVLTANAEAVTASGYCGDPTFNESENVAWSLEDGVLTISGTGAMENFNDVAPWYNYSSDITEVVIENGVTRIGSAAFYGCSMLISVTIPDSVTRIGNSAFSECSNLTSVTIPDTVASIGDHAFYYCIRLKSVTIPESVKGIGCNAFELCESLYSVVMESEAVSPIDNNAFKSTNESLKIYVPETAVGSYKNEESWSVYNENIIGYSDIQLPDGKYKQTAEMNGIFYTRFVFVVPEKQLEGMNKAVFIVHYDGTDYTYETSTYYEGVISNWITYTPASESDRVMFVVTVSSSSDIREELKCKLDFE